jgi:hypothetical protein
MRGRRLAKRRDQTVAALRDAGSAEGIRRQLDWIACPRRNFRPHGTPVLGPVKATRPGQFGFGSKATLINIDLRCAYRTSALQAA